MHPFFGLHGHQQYRRLVKGQPYDLHIFGAVRDGTPSLHLELGACP